MIKCKCLTIMQTYLTLYVGGVVKRQLLIAALQARHSINSQRPVTKLHFSIARGCKE